MATDQQVALTRSNRIPSTSSHISKAARQVVPAFLQKLYEMVNDPNNAELIRWSEMGDSFFVLDHERFAHEVLGRWFKHRNFSSFVRQLNMYGFHKIPHLQQGVLKSDTDTEFWNFAHANFHRGQPDLLCLIQRKKQAAQQGDESAIEPRDATNGVGLIGGPNTPTGNTAGSTAALSNGQVLDVQSIISGINAIKRHQTTISAELNELKRSNQLLWQDALATRTRHQKQQDMINRIVKFLAGVFGNHAATAVPDGTPSVNGGQGNQDGVDGASSGPTRRVRLMIEDAKRDGPTKSMVEELTEMPTELDSEIQYEAPIAVSPPKLTLDGSSFHFDTINGVSMPQHPQQIKPTSETRQDEQQGKQISRAVTPNRSPTAIEFEIHNMINQLSSSQLQLLLASITPQTIADPAPPAPSETNNPTATSSLTQYQPPFDFSQGNVSFSQLPIVDGLIPFDDYDLQVPGDATPSVVPSGQQEHEQRMENQGRAAKEIDREVSAVDTSINSLIHQFGMGSALLDESNQNPSEVNGSDLNAAHGETTTSDFDFDSFLKNLSNDSSNLNSNPNPNLNLEVGMDYDMDDLISAAFLDEVHTPTESSDMTASPAQPLRQVTPEITMAGTSDNSPTANLSKMNINGSGTVTFDASTGRGVAGRKRKSDILFDIDPATVLSDPLKGVKPKRRKEQ